MKLYSTSIIIIAKSAAVESRKGTVKLALTKCTVKLPLWSEIVTNTKL